MTLAERIDVWADKCDLALERLTNATNDREMLAAQRALRRAEHMYNALCDKRDAAIARAVMGKKGGR